MRLAIQVARLPASALGAPPGNHFSTVGADTTVHVTSQPVSVGAWHRQADHVVQRVSAVTRPVMTDHQALRWPQSSPVHRASHSAAHNSRMLASILLGAFLLIYSQCVMHVGSSAIAGIHYPEELLGSPVQLGEEPRDTAPDLPQSNAEDIAARARLSELRRGAFERLQTALSDP